MSAERRFAAALWDAALPCPAGLVTWNGSAPDKRFGVYRNNVIVSLVDALADTFPVTLALVGEDFFRAMARLFVVAQPPASPVLALYGAAFPDFIGAFPPAAGLPYLADAARLEYLRVRAFHAADVAPLGAAELAAQLADEAALPGLVCVLHPSLALLPSRFAVVSLWAAHQGLMEISAVDPAQPETALVLRAGLAVEVLRLPPAGGAFIAALLAGAGLGRAVEEAGARDAAFVPAELLALLLQKSVLTAFLPARSAS